MTIRDVYIDYTAKQVYLVNAGEDPGYPNTVKVGSLNHEAPTDSVGYVDGHVIFHHVTQLMRARDEYVDISPFDILELGANDPPAGAPIVDAMWADVVFFYNSELANYEAVKGGANVSPAYDRVSLEQGIWNGKTTGFSPATSSDRNRLQYAVDIDLDKDTGFTVDCWLRSPTNGPNSYPTYFSMHDANHLNPFLYLGLSDIRGYTMGGETGFMTNDKIPLSRDQWHHMAFVFDGVLNKGYMDGKKILEVIAIGPSPQKITTINLGNRGNQGNPFLGLLDEVRITKGIRWTADFTPPAGPVDVAGS